MKGTLKLKNIMDKTAHHVEVTVSDSYRFKFRPFVLQKYAKITIQLLILEFSLFI